MRYKRMRLPAAFYKEFLALASMLMLQNVVTLAVNLLDNIMLGAYSEAALSGVAAVNQIQFVYQQLLMALGEGVVIFSSQYWGRRQTGPIKQIGSYAMRGALVISVILFAVVSLFPMQMMHIFTTDATITAEGMAYLRVIRWTYPIFAVTQILLALMRSIGTVQIAYMLAIQSLIVNCSINYTLIYGHYGAPRLGTTGAAIGTLVARIAECGVLVLYLIYKERTLRLRPGDFKSTDRMLNKDYRRIVAPMLFTNSLWGFNTAMQTVILGHMETAAIAANSVASNLFLLVKAMPVGAANAASVMIGRKVGEGDMDVVRNYARELQRMFVLIGCVAGIVLFFLRIPILQLYDLSDTTREMANTFLLILSVVAVTMSYQMPTNTGIIRGGGNAIYVVYLDIICIWVIVMPLSLFMAFVMNASPVVVVWCLNSDQIFKCIPAFIEANYGNWIRKLTRETI